MATPTDRSVSVIALGGTIASTSAQSPGGSAGGVAPRLSAEALLAGVPGLDETGIKVTASTFRAVASSSLGLDDLAELTGLVEAEVEAGRDGIVISQGTDTLEETAFYLDLATDLGAPVVVTGAMRNPTLAGADGPANLLASVQVAADPAARELGCLVVFNDEIHAARLVRKAHTTSTAAFSSPDAGPLGRVVEGMPRLYRRHVPTPTLRPTMPAEAAKVAVLTTWLGDDGALLPGLGDRFDGLVLAGMGGGHVPERMAGPLGELAGRIPVVLSSRTLSGPLLRGTYGFPGSERDLLGRGLLSAGSLDPYKARILLHLLLASGADAAAIAETFRRVGGESEAW